MFATPKTANCLITASFSLKHVSGNVCRLKIQVFLHEILSNAFKSWEPRPVSAEALGHFLFSVLFMSTRLHSQLPTFLRHPPHPHHRIQSRPLPHHPERPGDGSVPHTARHVPVRSRRCGPGGVARGSRGSPRVTVGRSRLG